MSSLNILVPQRNPARSALRAATDAAHTRLHHQPQFADLAAGRIGLNGYRHLLARLHGFHAPLESRLLAVPLGDVFGVRMAPRRRVRLLYQDLVYLGLGRNEITALPRVHDFLLPDMSTPGRFLGSLYVREGATLGGRVLARALDAVLGAGDERGRCFLSGTGDDPAEWRALCDALEMAGGLGHLGDLIAGATDTFAAMEAWLDPAQWQPEPETRLC